MENIRLLEKINNRIMQLKKEKIQFITQYVYVQESFDRIIIPTGMKNSGLIRTYDEAKEFMNKKYPKYEYTEEEYRTELFQLLRKIKEVLKNG